MTIKELLELVLPSSARYDAPFERMFRSMVERVVKNRERVNAAKPGDYKAAEKFLESWTQLLDLFADDPRSLAALTAPRVKIQGKGPCPTGFAHVFPDTVLGYPPTVMYYLYFLEAAAQQPKRKPKGSPSKSRKASKKVKT